jgi:hypothetical protein
LLGVGLLSRALTIAPLLRQDVRDYCRADGVAAPEDDDGEAPR